jgi:hypothetical protein
MEAGKTRYGEGDLLSVPALHRDGRTISIEFMVVPLKNESEQMIGIVAIMRDVAVVRFSEPPLGTAH